MSFESSYCTLSSISAMHEWQDKLKGDIPLFGNEFFILSTSFVVQDLEIDAKAAVL
jgi:hypothetical protein